MVVLENKDSRIWELETKIIEIIEIMIDRQPLNISLNMEGPCAKDLGLYKLLDTLTEKFKYPKSMITINTCNLLETHAEYNIVRPLANHLHQITYLNITGETPIKSFDADLKHFGCFISRTSQYRIWIASELYADYKEISMLTFHYNKTLDYFRESLPIDVLLNDVQDDPELLGKVFKLIENSPLTLHEDAKYPLLLTNDGFFNLAARYRHFFVEIVCETYLNGNTFFPTEKIWRAIALKTPFIVHGPRNYLDNLKKLGFKTFDQWWSEQYNNYEVLPAGVELTYSMLEIIKVIDNLSEKSVIELEVMYEEMKPILDHNYNLFMELGKPGKYII